MLIVRRLGALVLVIAAVAVWFGMKPSESVSSTYDAAISAVLAGDSQNQSSADSAPQQQVVNGWTARDLLTIIAKQGSAPSATDDPRPSALLTLAVVGIALLLFTGGVAAKAAPQSSSPQPEHQATPPTPAEVQALIPST